MLVKAFTNVIHGGVIIGWSNSVRIWFVHQGPEGEKSEVRPRGAIRIEQSGDPERS